MEAMHGVALGTIYLFIYLFICTEQSALLVCSGKKTKKKQQQQQKTVLT